MNTKFIAFAFTTALAASGVAFAAEQEKMDMADLSVSAKDQDTSGGTVTADKIMAAANGWLVVHRTDAEMKPGPSLRMLP